MSETTIWELAHLVKSLHIIIPYVMYRKDFLQEAGDISDKTLNRWEQAGLRACKPGTRHVWYCGTEIIQVMQKPEDEIPPYKPKIEEKPKKPRKD